MYIGTINAKYYRWITKFQIKYGSFLGISDCNIRVVNGGCPGAGLWPIFDKHCGGKSLSVRELATKVFGKTRGGELADDGIGAQLVLAYYPTRRLGLATRFSYNQNRTREEGIKLIASESYGVENPVVESTEGWNATSAMIGPSLRLGGEDWAWKGACWWVTPWSTAPCLWLQGPTKNTISR